MKEFLTTEWKYLLMLNYEIEPYLLENYVPQGTKLDSFNGITYISVVGLLYTDTKIKGFSIPLHKDFEEINLRFYVKRTNGDEIRKGVVFIKEIVPKLTIAAVAKLFYDENFVSHRMRSALVFSDEANEDSEIFYEWENGRTKNRISAKFRANESITPEHGSFEEYITVHHWGYTTQSNGSTMEYRVKHPKWNIWPAREAGLVCDIEKNFGKEFIDTLSSPFKSAFIADGSKVTVYEGVLI